MKTRVLATLIALGVFGIAGIFIWAALRPATLAQLIDGQNVPTAAISEALADGRVDAQIYATRNRDVQLDVKFTPDADAIETVGAQPSVSFTMANIQMGWFDPPLKPVAAGVWRTNFKLPTTGRWIVSVGFGEEFAEVEFDAQ